MAGAVLATKLFLPKPRRVVVPRPRLTERLDHGTESKLTLVSAPAGFGKSSLLADWLAATPADVRARAWLSLDPGDDHAEVFWTHLIAALQTAIPGVGADALATLQARQPPIEAVLTTLLNDLSAVSKDLMVALDDYHAIESDEIQRGMTFLLEHLPPHVHLIIATRADPALPLGRLRGRGELAEIRAVDLRFTPDEAAAYLNGSMQLALTADDVLTLEERTEGWIAGLQLAALSIQGRDDAASFIASFAGDDRYIVDYLVGEVLARQSEAIRGFLLHTAILERLTGPLCDAVTGRDDGRELLEALDRANLFLVALDDKRRWYRYHHLFADVLRTRLLDEQPAEVPRLHRRASEWLERNGDRSEAIRHAIAGDDVTRAAGLIELAIPELSRARGEPTLRRWMDALPRELFETRPVLAAGYAGVLMQMGEFGPVDALLRAAERSLEGPDEARVVIDSEALRYLPGQLAMLQGGLARILGDLPGTIANAQRAIERADPDDHLGRGGAAALLGLAYWETGDLDAAYRWFADGMASLEAGGYVADVVGGAVTLADIRVGQGRLHDAMRIYERGLELATGQGGPPLRGAADMHVGKSRVLRERNELQQAAHHLAASHQLGDENGLPKNPGRSRIAAALIMQAEGDLDGALGRLDEAERHFFSDMSPDAQPIGALRARMWIAQGRLADARAWAEGRGLTPDDALTYLREFEHATLARLMLAEATSDRADDRVQEVIDLTARMVEAADAGGRNGAAVDILVVQVLAHDALGARSAALASLTRAFALTEPEGYARVFLDEGVGMATLVKEAAKRAPAGSYVGRLQSAFVTAAQSASPAQRLVEPLSERELEVLRMLATELSGPEIADHLVVSLNTFRTHTKNLFAKLGVNSRRAAVRRGQELELLTPAR